jgi:hypothetical protein
MKLFFSLLCVALLASGCKMKTEDPVVTTSGNPPSPKLTQVPVTLTWGTSTGTVQGYKVEASLDGKRFVEIGTVPYSPGYDSVGVQVKLPTGAKYFFRIRSFNQGGNSPYTAVTSVSI